MIRLWMLQIHGENMWKINNIGYEDEFYFLTKDSLDSSDAVDAVGIFNCPCAYFE